ncbi:MAG TPA: hypothetical protein VJM69_04015 [Dehalococcoidia bacterium]|nr:hypothetical protein [Dehalococcoidia bacterium]
MSRSKRFWTGVLIGAGAALILSRRRPDLNRIARAEYNIIAPFYDAALERFGGLHDVRRELAEKLELSQGDVVLEVCVGTGANLPYIA